MKQIILLIVGMAICFTVLQFTNNYWLLAVAAVAWVGLTYKLWSPRKR